MKKVENLLNKSPLTQPSETMGKNAEVLFDQARSNARHNLLEFRVPAWGAVAACVACLFIGRLWVPAPESQQANSPPPVPVPQREQLPTIQHESEPQVFVQITRHPLAKDSSPFMRERKVSSNRFSTSWTVTN